MNCSEPKRYLGGVFLSPPYFREPDPLEREKAVWGEIAYAFSEPVMPNDLTADYAPTQVLAEVFKTMGCDGLYYKSRLGKGLSVALFDVASADVVNCSFFQLKCVKFEFKDEGSPYFVKEQYPDLVSREAR